MPPLWTNLLAVAKWKGFSTINKTFKVKQNCGKQKEIRIRKKMT